MKYVRTLAVLGILTFIPWYGGLNFLERGLWQMAATIIILWCSLMYYTFVEGE